MSIFFHAVVRKLTGFKMKIKKRRTGAALKAVISGVSFANTFGEISQKSMRRTVITSVAMLTPLVPKTLMKSAVARAEEATLTALFPIKTVESILSYVSSILRARRALLLFAARLLSFIWLSDEKAISHAEKNAEKHNKTTSVMIKGR